MDFHSKQNVRADDNVRNEPMNFILSQYSTSANILEIMACFRKEITAVADFNVFYDKLFNIYTAEGAGLDVWGDILGVSRTITSSLTNNSLTLEVDEDYRTLLLFKALSNILDATIPTLLRLIQKLFPDIDTYVLNIEQPEIKNGSYFNTKPMQIRWVFDAFLTDRQVTIFSVAGIWCKGAGVGWGMYATKPEQVFGFNGGDWQPFNQGCFDPIGVVGGI